MSIGEADCVDGELWKQPCLASHEATDECSYVKNSTRLIVGKHVDSRRYLNGHCTSRCDRHLYVTFMCLCNFSCSLRGGRPAEHRSRIWMALVHTCPSALLIYAARLCYIPVRCTYLDLILTVLLFKYPSAHYLLDGFVCA